MGHRRRGAGGDRRVAWPRGDVGDAVPLMVTHSHSRTMQYTATTTHCKFHIPPRCTNQPHKPAGKHHHTTKPLPTKQRAETTSRIVSLGPTMAGGRIERPNNGASPISSFVDSLKALGGGRKIKQPHHIYRYQYFPMTLNIQEASRMPAKGTPTMMMNWGPVQAPAPSRPPTHK